MTFKPGYKRSPESKIKQSEYWKKRREAGQLKSQIKAKQNKNPDSLNKNLGTPVKPEKLKSGVPDITHSNNLHSKILSEINLNGEFKNMSETINPKKNEKTEDAKYECGACHAKFNEKMKFCPGCGIEFQV